MFLQPVNTLPFCLQPNAVLSSGGECIALHHVLGEEHHSGALTKVSLELMTSTVWSDLMSQLEYLNRQHSSEKQGLGPVSLQFG